MQQCLEHACWQSTSDHWADFGMQRPFELRFAIGQDVISAISRNCSKYSRALGSGGLPTLECTTWIFS